jgi:hypothetical protein
MKYALAIVIAILLLPIAIVSLWLILAMCTIGPAVGQATSAAALHSAADTLQNAPDGLKSIAKEVSKPFVEARKKAERDRESEEQAAADAEHDANHPDLSDPLSKDDYDQNPALYTKGWKDGWQWASALPDKSQTYSDQCDKISRKKYGNIDKEGSKAQTESFGFMAAAAYVREHPNGDQDADPKRIRKQKILPDQCLTIPR